MFGELVWNAGRDHSCGDVSGCWFGRRLTRKIPEGQKGSVRSNRIGRSVGVQKRTLRRQRCITDDTKSAFQEHQAPYITIERSRRASVPSLIMQSPIQISD
jgi:hypothetical protein